MPEKLRALLAAAALAALAAATGCAGSDPEPVPEVAAPGSATAAAPARAPDDTGPALAAKTELALLCRAALAANPTLAAARHRWEAAIEEYPVETALPDPEAMYSYGLEDEFSRNMVQVRQAVPFPLKLVRRGEVVEKDVEIARREFEIATADVLAELKSTFHELVFLDESARITTEHQEVLRALLAHATSEHAAGRAEFAEVQRAQAQLAQLDYDLVVIAELRASEVAGTNSLLSRPPSSPLGPAGPVPVPGGVRLGLPELAAEVERSNLEVRRDEAKIEKAGSEVDLAKAESFPDFSLGFTFEDERTPSEAEKRMDDDWKLDFGVMLPLWRPKYEAMVRGAMARKREAEAERTASENDANRRIARAYFRMRNAARLARLYVETLIPQSRHAMSTAREWYQAGKGSYSHFLEVEQVLLSHRLGLARASADYYQNLAELERAVGRPLPELVEVLAPEEQP
ncbi:MAG: TolC family protein [Planctomycetes bacterium]|nr:TolC family protein [Planctomycetota bacterium]